MESSLNNRSAPATIDSHLVHVPGGKIELRDDRVKQKWTVQIAPFFLARFPVTQGMYAEITGQSPATFKGTNHPVETVTWLDAVKFCNALSKQAGFLPCYAWNKDGDDLTFDPKANGYRLPTESEWEYACKAGTTGVRYGALDEIGWYKANSGNSTHEVGRKAPNAWGLYDMLGNVWEWCSDIYDETVYGSYRILRGGGWADEERGCMATNRRRSHPVSFKIDDLGFRIARNR